MLMRLLEPSRHALSSEQQASAWADGQTMTLEQAIAYALEERAPDAGAADGDGDLSLH
jgi:hypothetical protein